MKLFHYCTNCVNHSNGAEITAMVDAAKEVSFDTMQRHCVDLQKWELRHGYNGSLRLKHDKHVRYYQSTFQGKECYFIVHSAIEYIWVKHEPAYLAAEPISDIIAKDETSIYDSPEAIYRASKKKNW